MGSTKNTPGTYTRPSSDAAYQAAIKAQQSARQKEAETKKAKDDKKKLQQQLTDAKAEEKKILGQKTAKEKELAPFEASIAQMKQDAISPSSPGGTTVTSTEQTAITNAEVEYIFPLQNQLNAINKRLADAITKRKDIEKKLGATQTTAAANTLKKDKASNQTTKKNNTNKTSGNNNIQTFSGYVPVSYVYNAPMISAAYLNPRGPQQGVKIYSEDGIIDNAQSNLLTRSVGAPKFTDQGENLWKGAEYSSKGVIQMNTEFNSSVISGYTKGTKYDDQLYGFRFLYNPKEVSMTWGLAEGVNFEAVQAGLDKSTPISTGLLNSTISFSLLLNRMGDMQYLDENGLIPGTRNPYPSFALSKGKTLNKELSEIYKRGTMYDLEYLFKTMMGINATYNSSLNGLTADRGWLQGLPIDLHLGDGLRYQVRVGSMDVNHVIFNDRMVPILSTVNITCHRFYVLAKSTSSTSAVRGGGRGAVAG